MEIINFKKTINLLLLIYIVSFIKCDLVIIGPGDLASRYNNQPIEIVFGKTSDISNFYAHGEIILENKTISHNACSELGILPTNINQNEYSENFKILLAYSGQCSIVQKTRNAQNAGAQMLLLINDNEEDIKDVILEDDGSGSDIKIPIGLISLSNGRIIQNYIETNPKSKILVEINYQKKEAKKRIELKLFFSSSELKAYELIEKINQNTNKFLDQYEFIPIYVTHQSPTYDPEKAQRELNCVTKGKYCYFPKENTITQDGQRILIESLRQKCMYIKSKDKLRYYYEYMQSFYKECLNSGVPRFNERCAKQVLENLGYPIDYLDECIADSFGVNSLLSSSYIDNENNIFKKEYEEILKYKLSYFPAVVIDDKPLGGIIKEYTIVEALCNIVSTKPDFCSYISGGFNSQALTINRQKSWIYFLIIAIRVINIILFCTFRKYIMFKINEKINFNTIDFEGRINNVVQNYMSIKKNQELDYQSFDTDASSKNNKGYNKIEGAVNTV